MKNLLGKRSSPDMHDDRYDASVQSGRMRDYGRRTGPRMSGVGLIVQKDFRKPVKGRTKSSGSDPFSSRYL